MAAYGCRALVAGEQNERAFVVGTVEGPFQGGEDPGEHVAEPVEHPDAVGDQVRAVGGQQSRIGCLLAGDVDGGEVPPQACGFCDHVGVPGVPGRTVNRMSGSYRGEAKTGSWGIGGRFT